MICPKLLSQMHSSLNFRFPIWSIINISAITLEYRRSSSRSSREVFIYSSGCDTSSSNSSKTGVTQ